MSFALLIVLWLFLKSCINWSRVEMSFCNSLFVEKTFSVSALALMSARESQIKLMCTNARIKAFFDDRFKKVAWTSKFTRSLTYVWKIFDFELCFMILSRTILNATSERNQQNDQLNYCLFFTHRQSRSQWLVECNTHLRCSRSRRFRQDVRDHDWKWNIVAIHWKL